MKARGRAVVKAAEPQVGGIRVGGRSARVVDEVLKATIELIGRSGYGALRVEEVALRSGVNKTTIYRRWPTKSALVAAAVRHSFWSEPAPDTGDLQHDLVAMYARTIASFDDQTRGILRMVQLERGDPEVDEIVRELKDRMTAIRRVRLDAAVRRGELPRRTDVALVLQIISGAIYSRVLNYTEPLPDGFIDEVVGIVLAGVKARRGT